MWGPNICTTQVCLGILSLSADMQLLPDQCKYHRTRLQKTLRQKVKNVILSSRADAGKYADAWQAAKSEFWQCVRQPVWQKCNEIVNEQEINSLLISPPEVLQNALCNTRFSTKGCQPLANQNYFLQQWCASQIAL